MEKIILNNPDQTVVGTPEYSVGSFEMNIGYDFTTPVTLADPKYAYVAVTLIGTGGLRKRLVVFKGQEAVNNIRLLNKANLTIKSLERRIMEAVQAKFPSLAGQITGVPD